VEKSEQKWIGLDRLGSDRNWRLCSSTNNTTRLFLTPFLHNGSQYVFKNFKSLNLNSIIANHWQRERSGSKCASAELGTRLASAPRNHNIDTDWI
jgi:hypothetical protein